VVFVLNHSIKEESELRKTRKFGLYTK